MVWTIILFVMLQLINVVLSTCKSIITVKGTVRQSAYINALSYSLHTVIVIFMAGEFTGNYYIDLGIKVASTAVTNLIGVHISAWVLNKFRKDKLWEIVATVQNNETNNYKKYLNSLFTKEKVSFNCMETNKQGEYVYHIYSKSQAESTVIKQALNNTKCKYVIHESEKTL